MAIKRYSKGLDLLLASIHVYRNGDAVRASKLFVKAAEDEGLNEVLDNLDEMNEEAAKRLTASADQKTKSQSKSSSLARLMAEAQELAAKKKAAKKKPVPKKKVKADFGSDDTVVDADPDGNGISDAGTGDEDLDDLLLEESDGDMEGDIPNGTEDLPEDDEVDVDSIIDSLDDGDEAEEVSPEVVDEDLSTDDVMARVTARVKRANRNLKALP